MMEKSYVVEKIKKAFADVKLGGAASIHQAQLTDGSIFRDISQKEYDDIRKLDTEAHWQDVPAKSIDECNAALCHLCPLGWKFYIPAYMVRAVELARTQEYLPDSVIFHLTYRNNKNIQDSEHRYLANRYTLDRFEGLDEKQVEAVIAFLEFMAANDPEFLGRPEDTATALKRYWALPKSERPNGK